VSINASLNCGNSSYCWGL